MSFSEKFKYEQSEVTMSDAAGDEEATAYRSVCGTAVATLVFGVLSCVCVVYRELFVYAIPILALVCAKLAANQIRRNPEVCTGYQLVTIGTVAAVAFTLISGGMYLHDRNRIPSDYHEISFDELQLTDSEKASGQRVPDKAKVLGDRMVWVRGYMSPGRTPTVRSFTLNSAQPDGCGHCAVDIMDTHHIFVRMKDLNRTTTYTTRQLTVGGRLQVNDPPVPNPDGTLKIYELEADFVR